MPDRLTPGEEDLPGRLEAEASKGTPDMDSTMQGIFFMRHKRSFFPLSRIRPRHTVVRHVTFILVLVALGFILSHAVRGDPASAATGASAVNATGKAPSWIEPEPFEYNPRNKPNPFEPFLRQAPSSQNEQSANREALSPLERVSPSQLKLEGILSSGGPDAASALVELPSGKAYVLRRGMHIGTEGARVMSIRQDSVVIREYYVDVMGEKKSKQTVLKLPQSAGEENE